jgi:hypothetical protein
MVKSSLLAGLRALLLGLYLGFLAPPYVGGLHYSLCGNHTFEQRVLDDAVAHVRAMRANCDDPDLAGILDYVLARYTRAGAWDVMFAPCIGVYPDAKTIGVNVPNCPGLTLDCELLTWAPEDVALVLIHEAMHDYYPYYGHDHINERERKFYLLSYTLRGR